MPQNALAGEVLVLQGKSHCQHQQKRKIQHRHIFANVIAPVNLEESVPPNVSSPLVIFSVFVGLKETATRFCVMAPCANRLSAIDVRYSCQRQLFAAPVTVGTVAVLCTVPAVSPTGPTIAVLGRKKMPHGARRTNAKDAVHAVKALRPVDEVNKFHIINFTSNITMTYLRFSLIRRIDSDT